MTSLASPEGLAITGSLFMLSGLAILGAALLSRTALAELVNSRLNSTNKFKVAMWFAIPIIGLGLFLEAVGKMVVMPIGVGQTALLLGLAFTLLMFLMLDETFADALAKAPAETKEVGQPALPELSAIDTSETTNDVKCEHLDLAR